jgi:hypothetical protein
LQEADDMEKLLTPDGFAQLKLLCFKNLDLKAKSHDELNIWKNYLDRAKEVRI